MTKLLCPVFPCTEHFDRIRYMDAENELTEHLAKEHIRSVHKNGIDALVSDAYELGRM